MRRRYTFALLLLCAGLTTRGWAETPPLTDQLVSPDHSTASGNWHYRVSRSATSFACDAASSSSLCVEQLISVINESKQTLECQLHVDYRNADGAVVNSFDAPVLVLPETSPVVHNLTTEPGLRAELRTLSCNAREPYHRAVRAKGCKYDMFGKPFETYYPPEAIRQSLQGPVIVSFMLNSPNGVAKDIKIAESSLVPSLDEAGRKFIADQMFSTNCPGNRFDIVMRFKLRDQVVAARH